jgi:hypothetical protein
MGWIYHNAICTIAATCAESVTDGFLSKVDSERIRVVPCKVIHRASNGESRPGLAKPCGIHYARVIEDSALNKRGWVTQERLLSRRVLHFTLQGVIWECSKTKEHGIGTVSRISIFAKSLLKSGAPSTFDSAFGKHLDRNDWMMIVSRYSETSFTNAEDRLIALSSLARFVHTKLGYDNVYCAGIWRESLEQDLLWHKKDPPNSKTQQRLNLAPTWSWASVTGAISCLGQDQSRKSFPQPVVLSAQVLSIHIVPMHHDNPYGNLLEGNLKLVAQVLDVLLWTKNVKSRKFSICDHNKPVSVWRSVYWDELQDDSTEEKRYNIIPFHPMYAYTSSSFFIEYAALIVEEIYSTMAGAVKHNPVRTFRRIGLLYKLHFHGVASYNYGQAVQEVETLVLV